MRQVNTRVTIVVKLQVTEIHKIMVHEQVCGAIEVLFCSYVNATQRLRDTGKTA